MKGSRPVYSTGGGGDLRKENRSPTGATWVRGSGPAKLRLETGGRGGKAVTVLFNLPLEEREAAEMLKEMQGKFGCGGTLKGATLELRGDVRDKVEQFMGRLGMKVVRAGG